jgi:ribokinase
MDIVQDVIGLGSLNYDYAYIVDSLAHGDQQVVIQRSHSSPGGSAANTIYAISRLGIKTGFVGAVGDDDDGKEIFSHMASVGIDTRHMKKLTDIPTAKVLIFVDSQGERAMYSLPGANVELQVNNQDIEYLKSCKYVVLSAIPGHESLEKLIHIVEQIHKDIKFVFMPGGLYSSFGFDTLKPIIKGSYFTILNRRELNLITGCKNRYIDGLSKLSKVGCPNVVVTAGKDGAMVYSNGQSLNVPTPILADDMVVDSTGTGDAFSAGLLYGLLNSKQLQESAFYGNLAARACIQVVGARAGLLDQYALEEDFKKFAEDKEMLNE